jgi:hypothetical protein
MRLLFIPSRATTIEVIVAEGLGTPASPASDTIVGVRMAWVKRHSRVK